MTDPFKRISLEQARAVLREYPDADMSQFIILDETGVQVHPDMIANEEGMKTLAKIREIAEKGTVQFADGDQLDSLLEEYEEFLSALKKARGISAWFSDRSSVGDVFDGAEDPRLALLAKELGVPVSSSDSVVNVCLRLRARRPATT